MKHWKIVCAMVFMAGLCYGCSAGKSTSVITTTASSKFESTVNGQTLSVENRVLRFEDRQYEVNEGAVIRVERRNGVIAKLFIDNKLVYAKENTRN